MHELPRRRGVPHRVFEAGEANDGIEWRTKYPDYNGLNLETHGVLQINGQNYIFCSKDHPAIDVLRQNKNLVNGDIDSQPLIDNEWFKILKPTFATCCDALRKRVLSSVPTRDLNNFHVQISRIARDDWTNKINKHDELMCAIPADVVASGDELRIGEHIKGIIDQPYTYSARLEITYEINV